MSTIPASEIVAVNPSVIAAGGSTLDVIGLILTASAQAPVGSVLSFPDAQAVSDYFGAASDEKGIADTYFAGFTNSNRLPGAVLFAQYNASAVAAYLRGGDVSATTLAALQAINGTLLVTVDGLSRSGSVNLAAASSFSSAAGIIETALNAALPAAASVTGSIGGTVTASAGASFTGTGSGTNLTTTAVTGVIALGATLSGTGVTAGTTIVSQTSGTTGGAGVYVTSAATTSSGDALNATSNVLNVTAIGTGSLQTGDAVSGTGVTSGSTILGQLTGTAGSTGTYVLNVAQRFASTTVTSLSTVLKVTAVGSGTIVAGDPISGTNVTANTTIVSQISGTAGGIGLYRTSLASTAASTTIAVTASAVDVTYDSTSGAFQVASGATGASSTAAFATGTTSAALKLTSATGAALSQGAAAAAPGAFMDALVLTNSNWVTFMTAFDPDVSGFANKQAFADWTDTQNDRYAYVCWDTDVTPTTTLPATASLGYALEAAEDSGTCLIYAPDADTGVELAAFVCGAAASIDFEQRDGRITFAFKSQAGLTASVTDGTIANNLAGSPQGASRGNGYNFYGAYGAANAGFTWFQRGFITGDFAFLDSYINQVWLNNELQVALLNLLENARSIPYTQAGYSRIEAAISDVIAAGLNFGAFAPGAISAAQVAAVNAEAGASIAGTLQTQGYYLQITPASSATRNARTSPPCKFFYLDRGAVQAINLSSIAVQ